MSSSLSKLLQLYGMVRYIWVSIKLLKVYKTGKTSEPKLKLRMRKTLQFWTVFASFSLYESYFEIFFFWLPFYFILKFLLLLWLIRPDLNGASIVFHTTVRPLILENQRHFVEFISPTIRRYTVLIETIVLRIIYPLMADEQLNQLQHHFDGVLHRLNEERKRRQGVGNKNEGEIRLESLKSTKLEDISCHETTLSLKKEFPWIETISSGIDAVICLTKETHDVIRKFSSSSTVKGCNICKDEIEENGRLISGGVNKSTKPDLKATELEMVKKKSKLIIQNGVSETAEVLVSSCNENQRQINTALECHQGGYELESPDESNLHAEAIEHEKSSFSITPPFRPLTRAYVRSLKE